MTTINNTDDLIEILRTDPVVRSSVRPELLTEEVLALPNRVSALTDRIDAIVERLDRQHDDLGTFRGNYASEAVRRNRYRAIRPFALERGIRLVKTSLIDEDELEWILANRQQTLDSRDFSDDALNSFPETDLVLLAENRRNSSQRFYMVIETSFTGTDHDINRARDGARILRNATDLDVYAVAAAVRWDVRADTSRVVEDVQEYIEADDESLGWTLRISSGVSEGVHKSVEQGDREFLNIGVGGRQ